MVDFRCFALVGCLSLSLFSYGVGAFACVCGARSTLRRTSNGFRYETILKSRAATPCLHAHNAALTHPLQTPHTSTTYTDNNKDVEDWELPLVASLSPLACHRGRRETAAHSSIRHHNIIASPCQGAVLPPSSRQAAAKVRSDPHTVARLSNPRRALLVIHQTKPSPACFLPLPLLHSPHTHPHHHSSPQQACPDQGNSLVAPSFAGPCWPRWRVCLPSSAATRGGAAPSPATLSSWP